MRVVDFTAFWAGPAATQALAALGADVIKVESVQRPDGVRFSWTDATEPRWWETGAVFHAVNAGKRGVTLDVGSPDGRALVLDLVDHADVVIENFSPRVLDNFGVTWPVLQARNPRVVMVRMPAFGLDGPWRDRTGFAQTMEQASGMAWMTGFADGLPVNLRGAVDPIAGMHATFALLAALDARDRTGAGALVEVAMIDVALNVAAEVVLEQSGNGVSLRRDGNRGPVSAPQGVYRCAGDDRWVAIAVHTDEQWDAFRRAVGVDDWRGDDGLRTAAGRRAAHDEIDRVVAEWCAGRTPDEVVGRLVGAGVPAAEVVPAHRMLQHPQLRARGFVEAVHHDVAGDYEVFSLPFRFASRPGAWFTRAAPQLGEHNDEVLSGTLGLSRGQVGRLRDADVVGDRPLGAS